MIIAQHVTRVTARAPLTHPSSLCCVSPLANPRLGGEPPSSERGGVSDYTRRFAYVVRNSPPSVGPINVHAGQSNESQRQPTLRRFAYTFSSISNRCGRTERIADGDATRVLAGPC